VHAQRQANHQQNRENVPQQSTKGEMRPRRAGEFCKWLFGRAMCAAPDLLLGKQAEEAFDLVDP
jgi:hypothetical protein